MKLLFLSVCLSVCNDNKLIYSFSLIVWPFVKRFNDVFSTIYFFIFLSFLLHHNEFISYKSPYYCIFQQSYATLTKEEDNTKNVENVIPETTANLDETQVLEAPKTTEKVPEVCTETPGMVYSIYVYICRNVSI